ncbi:MAG TPA: hypothetical protein VD978_30005 [Azospirillum sp.]|nr:hypothetical protein [Azospirillum sp.]
MSLVRRILSVLLILGLVSGTTVQAAQVGMMAGMPRMATMDHGDMAGCQGCVPSQDTDKGMTMAGCHNGICIVLPGLLPNAPDSLPVAPDTFVPAALTVTDGLSPPPDPRPPRPISLA